MQLSQWFCLGAAILTSLAQMPCQSAVFVGPRIEKFGNNPQVATFGAVVSADATGVYAYDDGDKILRRYDQHGELLSATPYAMPAGGTLFWLGEGLFLHYVQSNGPIVQLVSPEGPLGQARLLKQAATIAGVARVGKRAIILVNEQGSITPQANVFEMDLAGQNVRLLMSVNEQWYGFIADTNSIVALRLIPGVTQVGLRKYDFSGQVLQDHPFVAHNGRGFVGFQCLIDAGLPSDQFAVSMPATVTLIFSRANLSKVGEIAGGACPDAYAVRNDPNVMLRTQERGSAAIINGQVFATRPAIEIPGNRAALTYAEWTAFLGGFESSIANPQGFDGVASFYVSDGDTAAIRKVRIEQPGLYVHDPIVNVEVGKPFSFELEIENRVGDVSVQAVGLPSGIQVLGTAITGIPTDTGYQWPVVGPGYYGQQAQATVTDEAGQIAPARITFLIHRSGDAPTGISSRVVEFYNTLLGHYFITINGFEQQFVDEGGAGPGWLRTGQFFKAWLNYGDAPRDAAELCRFYGTPGIGPNSHFYTLAGAECEQVKRDPGWIWEAENRFYVVRPLNLGSRPECPSPTGVRDSPFVPVYRAYNNGYVRNDSNHRFTASRPTYNYFTRWLGWAAEGIVMCVAPY